MVFGFGDCRLDIGRRELRRRAAVIDLEPRVFDLLLYLLRHRDRVVSKEDLIAGVWGGRIVSDSALNTRINAVRRAIGDSGAAQRLIRTFARKGVRFVGEVTETAAEATPIVAAAGVGEAAHRPSPPLDRPSIAVLPFANLSDDPEQEYFADGMVEEIITALSRIRWLTVIARNSSFTYKGQAIDVKQVGRELGVRYALEGSVRRSAGRLRIAAQLIEAATDAHLWAEHFDGSVQDVFDLQDQVAINVAGIIEPTVQAAEAVRAAARPTHDLTAYDAYLRARAIYLASTGQVPQALALLEEAIARDPDYGPALAFAAMCCYRIRFSGLSTEPEVDRRKAIDYARRALRVAGDDPLVLADSALPLGYFGEDVRAMIGLVDRALALNPSFAHGWHHSAILRLWVGECDLAIAHEETAQRLSPRSPIGDDLLIIGTALFFSRRFGEALPKLLLRIQRDPSFSIPYRILAACYAHMGRLDEARAVVARLRLITPEVIPNPVAVLDPEHREMLVSGLRLAMGECD